MATYTWTGAAADGNFNNPANWLPQQVPGSADTAIISPSAALTLNIPETLANLQTGSLTTLTVGDYQTLQLGTGGGAAKLTLGGSLVLNNGHDAGLLLDATTTTLSGGGTITVIDRVIEASAAGQTLNNTGATIAGYGDLGYGTLTFVNGAAGVVDANQAGATLDLNTGTATITNSGLMEATAGGTLQIDSSVNDAAKAVIGANGGTVSLTAGNITGGTLSASNGGIFLDNGTATLRGGSTGLTLDGNLRVTDYSTLGLVGAISNAGTLSEDYVHGGGILIGAATNGAVTLSGGGTVTIASGLGASGTGDVLVNVDNTINGYDGLGDGTNLAITNEAAGVIDSTAGLTINTGTATLTNDGTVEATTGTLYIDSAVSNANTSAITAAGGNVVLQDGSSVHGGTLASSGGADVLVGSGGTYTVLDGSNGLTNTGTVVIEDYSTAILLGTITNTGTIAESYVHGTGLLVGPTSGAVGTVTLTGGGTVTLASALQATQAGETLVNVNNTINGYNLLGNGTNLAIFNQAGGIIDATGNLSINTGTTTLLNAGLLEASVTGTDIGGLYIDSTVDNGAAGIIAANGANVTLTQNAIVDGGTLTSSGGGRIVIDGDNNLAILDGTKNAVTNDAFIEVTDYDGVQIEGTFINNGTVYNDYVHGAGIVIASGTVFTNNGTLNANDDSVSFGAGTTLTNDVKGTLTGGTYDVANATLSFAAPVVTTLGAGTVLDASNGSIQFDGAAVIDSLRTVAAGATLVIENGSYTGGTQALSNAGTLQLDGATFGVGKLANAAGAAITGTGAIAASLANAGLIDATGQLLLTGSVNSLGGTLAGGAGDFLGFGGTTTLLGSAVITATDLAVLYGSTLHLNAALSYAGTLQLNGQTNVTGGALHLSGLLHQLQGGSGQGTIANALTSSGTILIDQGGTLSVADGLTNTGTILANGGLIDPHALTGGTLSIGASGSVSLATAAAAASTLAVLDTAGGSLTTNGTLTVTGDYDNSAAGSGNSYTPFAGVTGMIDGHGTKLSVVGVNGTHISSVNGTETITVAAGKTAYFEIENAGSATAAFLRGALETTVNGGSITGTALSGSGVTAADFGPIAGGAASGVFAITYSGGGLSGEAIHIASDFANVAGITLDIVAVGGQVPAGGAILSAGLPDHALGADWVACLHR